MSRKPFFKGFKKPTEAAPRDIDIISKEYSELTSTAGRLQYQIFVYKQELEQINARLVRINHEAAALKEQTPAQEGQENVETVGQ